MFSNRDLDALKCGACDRRIRLAGLRSALIVEGQYHRNLHDLAGDLTNSHDRMTLALRQE